MQHEDEIYEIYKNYCEEQIEKELNEIVWDPWENNIGECKAHFYGVCQGELTGKACEEPSEYGCSFKLPSP